MKKSLAERLRRTVLVVVAVSVAASLAGLPLYVFPIDDEIRDADTVFVLGPPTWQRIDVARDLLGRHEVSRALISVSPTGRQSAAEYAPCGYSDFECRTPDPFTTDGEAAMLRDFQNPEALEHQVVVVTFKPHVARARYILERCYDGDVAVIGVDQDLTLWDWAYQYVYQTAAFVKAAFSPCS
ncbi:hypothetical protein [Microbacterium sp. cf332]|uniref:hypothetical protein n=1 Tax=Microbacterium sp. cf332 TaxID=1761804 RepID=UPI000AD01D9A|nr:hypothetical protein [Microbacterium sp. cf332]